MHKSLNIDEAELAHYCEKHHIRRVSLFGSWKWLRCSMPPEDRIRIEYMIDAAGSVARFIAGRLRDDIESDEMLRFALVRAIDIFGEAASKVSAETRSAQENIPWQPIVGMRNRLIHAYFDIDADILWVAATQEVPALLPKLQVMTSEDSRCTVHR